MIGIKDESKILIRRIYKFFKIIYVLLIKKDFKIDTSDVDKEISSIARPQLLVPVDNVAMQPMR